MHADPYTSPPRPRSLLTLFGAETGWAESRATIAETTDENPDRVAVVQRLTWAFLVDHAHRGDSAGRKRNAR